MGAKQLEQGSPDFPLSVHIRFLPQCFRPAVILSLCANWSQCHVLIKNLHCAYVVPKLSLIPVVREHLSAIEATG